MKRKKLTTKMRNPKCDMPIPRDMIFKSFAFEAVCDLIHALSHEASRRRGRSTRSTRRLKK